MSTLRKFATSPAAVELLTWRWNHPKRSLSLCTLGAVKNFIPIVLAWREWKWTSLSQSYMTHRGANGEISDPYADHPPSALGSWALLAVPSKVPQTWSIFSEIQHQKSPILINAPEEVMRRYELRDVSENFFVGKVCTHRARGYTTYQCESAQPLTHSKNDTPSEVCAITPPPKQFFLSWSFCFVILEL